MQYNWFLFSVYLTLLITLIYFTMTVFWVISPFFSMVSLHTILIIIIIIDLMQVFLFSCSMAMINGMILMTAESNLLMRT